MYIYYVNPTINLSHTTACYCYYVYTHAQSSCLYCYYMCLILLHTTAYVSHTTVYHCCYIYTQYSRAHRCGAQSSWLYCLLSPSLTLTSCTAMQPSSGFSGTQFTCFTGTKVQILTQKALVVLYNATAWLLCRGPPSTRTPRSKWSDHLMFVCV